MLTLGSISRATAAARFDFLAPRFAGRRRAIRAFTHRAPDFVFWIYPDGRLHDARDSHARHPPPGFESIIDDEPDYGGFLRGRVASLAGDQLIAVYCRPEALATPGAQLTQLLTGLARLPIHLSDGALVISDNGDLYGTLIDLRERQRKTHSPEESTPTCPTR